MYAEIRVAPCVDNTASFSDLFNVEVSGTTEAQVTNGRLGVRHTEVSDAERRGEVTEKFRVAGVDNERLFRRGISSEEIRRVGHGCSKCKAEVQQNHEYYSDRHDRHVDPWYYDGTLRKDKPLGSVYTRVQCVRVRERTRWSSLNGPGFYVGRL